MLKKKDIEGGGILQFISFKLDKPVYYLHPVIPGDKGQGFLDGFIRPLSIRRDGDNAQAGQVV